MHKNLFSIIQKIFITLSLFFIYFFCFAFTLLIVWIFKRSILKEADTRSKTFWRDVEGYGPDIKDCLRQS